MLAGMLLALLVPPFAAFLELSPISNKSLLLFIVLMVACPTVIRFFQLIFDNQVARHETKKKQK